MAFLGGLGKMLGVSTQGVAQGFFERGSEYLKEEEERNEQKLVALKQKKAERKADRDQRLAENTKSVQEIAATAGGLDEAEYLIREYGIHGAKERAPSIRNMINLGYTSDFITDPNNTTTLEDLANFITNQELSVPIPEYEDTSLLAALGAGRDLRAEAGIEDEKAPESVEDILGERLTPSVPAAFMDALVDPKDEAFRLLTLEANARQAGETEKADMIRQQAIGIIERLNVLKGSKAGTGLTASATRSEQNVVTAALGAMTGLEVKVIQDPSNPNLFTSILPNAKFEIKQRVEEVAKIATQTKNRLIINNQEPADIDVLINKILNENKVPLVGKDLNGNLTVIAGDAIFPKGLTNGKGAYALVEPTNDTNSGDTRTEDAIINDINTLAGEERDDAILELLDSYPEKYQELVDQGII